MHNLAALNKPYCNLGRVLLLCVFFFKFQIQDVIFSKDGSEFFSTGDLVSRDSSDRNIMAWDFDNAVVKSNQIYQVRILIALMWKIKFKIKYQWTKKKNSYSRDHFRALLKPTSLVSFVLMDSNKISFTCLHIAKYGGQ